MSDSENFLSRWLRLKRESEDALPEADVPSLPDFDPASLPPIESIVADSDIRQFLQANVPAELTHAALRRAWAADPAIRDFIGIAENQWDFNGHAAIPGFGPLQAADYLVAQAFGNLSDDARGTPEGPGTVEAPALPSHEPVDEVRQDAAAPADSAHDSVSVEENLGARVAYSHGGALPK
jgi:hypothetical protein